MVETSMIYYPNPQNDGVSLDIQVEENGEIVYSAGITGRFDQKFEFTVNEGAEVTVLALSLKKGRCANGILIAPILKRKGTSGPAANILPFRDDWYSSNRHYTIDADGIRYTPKKTSNSTYKITETNDGIECMSYDPKLKKPTSTGATADTRYYFINAYGTGTKAHSLVLSAGTYVFQNKAYSTKHWDVVRGYKASGNPTKWKKSGFPIFYQKMYFEEEGGMIWEKTFGKKVYLLSNADQATSTPYMINKDDYSVYLQDGPTVDVQAIAQTMKQDHYYVNEGTWGANSYKTPHYFIRVRVDYRQVPNVGRVYFSMWFVSKNLKEWVYTEGPQVYGQYYLSFSRLKDQGLAMSPDEDFLYIVRIKSDGHLTFEQKSLPTSFIQSKGHNNWTSLIFHEAGVYMYNPHNATDKEFDDDHPLLKSYYGIDVDGNLFDTMLKRDYPPVNLVRGWKEDCAYRVTNEVDPEGVYYQLHTIVTSEDGFKTHKRTSALIMPNYTLQRIYDVPKYGMRCSFRRRDLQLQKDVYDIYDTDGHVLGYNVEQSYDIPFVGFNADRNNYERYTPNGIRTFNWNPTYPGGSSDLLHYQGLASYGFYTEGNGPLPPDIVVLNSGGYTNSNLVVVCPYDEMGRPLQTSDNMGFCYASGCLLIVMNDGLNCQPQVPSDTRLFMYYEDCKHPGRHITTKVEWRDE